MDVVSTPLVDIRTVCALALIVFFDMASAIVQTSRHAPMISATTRNESETSHCNTERNGVSQCIVKCCHETAGQSAQRWIFYAPFLYQYCSVV